MSARKRTDFEETLPAEAVGESNGSALAETPAEAVGEFSVTLHASTPLRANPLRVKASSEQDAIKAFNAANGISGSDHRYEVSPV